MKHASPRRTYSLLGAHTDAPSEYEIVSSRLHYYVARGFEVDVPLQAWYRDFQRGTPLRASDWDAFSDPHELTYAAYVASQNERERRIDALLEQIDASDSDRRLSQRWLEALSQTLAPLRYPLHGLQMAAAYVAQMAPSGRLTIVGLFQAADELRRLERLAYRMCQLQRVSPRFGADAKQAWERGSSWQPLRESIEHLLITYDWSEAFVALCLCMKPLLDDLTTLHWPAAARAAGDETSAGVLELLREDCAGHLAWAGALTQLLLREEPSNRDVMLGFIAPWKARGLDAMRALSPLFMLEPEQAMHRLAASHAAWLRGFGLGAEPS